MRHFHPVTPLVLILVLVLPMVATGRYSSTLAQQQDTLTPADYMTYQPNELGRVPILMYHSIVPDGTPPDSSVDAYMYRTHDQFWNDMLWLYEHGFYLVGMNDLISGNLDVPLGKHPVVFTFDDSTSLQFSVIVSESGEISIDPDCAVGMMERFYAQYPDFGRGAHFGLVPGNLFSWPANDQDEHFEWKMQWLIENGYEVGNHTNSHPDLLAVDDEHFTWTISGPILWADGFMGADHPQNASRVLTLPFGIGPNETTQPHKMQMLRAGFVYDGHPIQLTGVLELVGGSSEVPWSNSWDAFSIPRLPAEDSVLDEFKEVYLAGENPYYTSDGNMNVVTVPWPLPEMQWGKLNTDAIHGAGKTLVKYNPKDGSLINKHASSADRIVAYGDRKLTTAAIAMG